MALNEIKILAMPDAPRRTNTALHGRLTRGVPTAYAAAPLNKIIAPSSDPPPVWPHKGGGARGVALAPLYPTAPDAALRDEMLFWRSGPRFGAM
jgi:hypothetical protein